MSYKATKTTSYPARNILAAAVFIAAFAFIFIPRSHGGEITFSPLPDIKDSDSILIFAPHPDDESLGTGGLIRKALDSNARVAVVLFTNGSRSHDGDTYEAFLKDVKNPSLKGPLGQIRRQETLDAMRELGLDESNVIFLGYPDGGLRALFNDYWDCDRPYRADGDFNRSDHSPYDFSHQKDAPYCGANVAANLDEIFRARKPNIIFYPDDGDFHEDHWATSAFVRYTGSIAGYDGEWYTYLVHKGNDWPSPPEYLPNTGLTLPPELSVLDASWLMLPLNPDQVARKDKAINSHASQLFLWKDYLMSFVRVNEIFGAYPYVIMSRVGEDPNFFRDGAPPSSFPDVRMDNLTSSLQTTEDLTRLGIAYNDKSAYLILQSARDIETSLVHHFHLRMWDKKRYTRLDVKVQGKAAAYERKAADSIMPDLKPGVEIRGNMMVIAIPYSCIQTADEVMLSADVSDPEDKTVIDFTSFRDMAYTAK
ncbi:MAG: PIG-L family deacetylase [Syntrophobacteraceae bacterium]